MSIYHFVRGPRLFIQAAREDADPDAVNQNPDDEMLEYGEVQTQRIFNTESHSSAAATNRVARKGGLKSVTRKIIRKTTTLTRGEQRTVTESLVMTGKDGKEVSTPQRYVSEKVVKTPWTDDMEDGAGAHSSGSSTRGDGGGGKGKTVLRHTKEVFTSTNNASYSNGHKSVQNRKHAGDNVSKKVNDLTCWLKPVEICNSFLYI